MSSSVIQYRPLGRDRFGTTMFRRMNPTVSRRGGRRSASGPSPERAERAVMGAERLLSVRPTDRAVDIRSGRSTLHVPSRPPRLRPQMDFFTQFDAEVLRAVLSTAAIA